MGGDILRRPGRGRRRSRAQDATGLALPYLISPQFPPGGCKTLTEKTSAAAAAADAGLVFINYGCHRIIREIDNRNKPAPLVASAEATGERGQNLYRYWLNLFAVGAGNNFLRCTDACGGRERPGKASL